MLLVGVYKLGGFEKFIAFIKFHVFCKIGMCTLIQLLLFTLSLFVMGCATTYQPKSLTGGYKEVRLADNIFRVTFNGNGYTSSDRASNYCLLRCAELCIENGFKYFTLVSAVSGNSSSSFTTPAYAQTTFIGNTGYTNVYGGQTINVSKPSSSNEIICFKDKPDGFFYEAAYVVSSIKEKYNITSD